MLHKHPDCSEFFHDLLNLIQDEMLIVESDYPRKKRIKADKLLKQIKDMKSKCHDEKYLFDGCPRETTHQELDPVEVPLHENALRVIKEEKMNEKVPEYEGSRRTANPRTGPPVSRIGLGT
jgi:hypothetical protein